MLGALRKMAEGHMNKYSGKTDFLEAVCASIALLSAADGEIEDSEVTAGLKSVSANKTLTAGFDARTIERTLETMFKRANEGRMGKVGLWREVEETANSHPDWCEDILLAALDTAEGDGEIEDTEKLVLDKLSGMLKLDWKKYLV